MQIDEIIKESIQRNNVKETALINGNNLFAIFETVFRQLTIENSFSDIFKSKLLKVTSNEIQFQFGNEVIIALIHPQSINAAGVIQANSEKYIKENALRTICSMVLIYSFRLHALEKSEAESNGFLLARIFINADNHFFVESHQPQPFLWNQIGDNEVKQESVKQILSNCLHLSQQIQLYAPSYSDISVINLSDKDLILENSNSNNAHRLGFIQSDKTDEFGK